MNLMAGKKITLKVTGTTSTVTWTSSDESIATVSDKGVVKGIKKEARKYRPVWTA